MRGLWACIADFVYIMVPESPGGSLLERQQVDRMPSPNAGAWFYTLPARLSDWRTGAAFPA
jgi:hypothetical protein